MSVAIVTGSSGLIGSETVKFLHEKGMQVVGIDNDMRKYFFGAEASTAWNTQQLQSSLKNFQHHPIDIRDEEKVRNMFAGFGKDISLVVHTAAQPSHDWAAKEPFTDFTINANGTLVMLESTRQHCPDAAFIFTSTNKVYGDTPNRLPLTEKEMRWEIDESHPFHDHGIDETMNIDQSKHSLFGVSKVAADIAAQEYGRYFGLKTGTFRGGCLTGPAHSGAELHGFLAYLARCAVTGTGYTIYGYKGKQVRDNIHSYDLVNAFWHFFQNPEAGAVYNMGGSRYSNCSVLEAISIIEELTGRKLNYKLSDDARSGDHIWWISDVRKFQQDYPGWTYTYDLKRIIQEIVEATQERTKEAS
ncbi:MAG TPA: NAD-dependent epimerase/dehydratase family protein [Pyrinomonadaceae bacterium]|nr:NAD-dependent epimerase/dehydratase family protein [Pyrinomonadaceae bacterium]